MYSQMNVQQRELTRLSETSAEWALLACRSWLFLCSGMTSISSHSRHPRFCWIALKDESFMGDHWSWERHGQSYELGIGCLKEIYAALLSTCKSSATFKHQTKLCTWSKSKENTERSHSVSLTPCCNPKHMRFWVKSKSNENSCS